VTPEVLVLTLVAIVLVLWVVLTVLLSAWTLWFQGYIYNEATSGISWRGPAAGAAVMVIVVVWIFLDYRDPPGRFKTLFESSSTVDSKPFPELRVPGKKGEDLYKLVPGTREYRLKGQPTGKVLPSRPERVIVMEGEERYVFEPERDAKGKFKMGTASSSSWLGSAATDELRYIDQKGRVMVESSLGQLSTFRGGRFIGNLFLNFFFLAVWFVVLWLLLRFQWAHALGQAVVFWGVMQLFVLPPVLTRAETVAKERAQARMLAS
jgi:hypothetical protein